MNALQVRPVFSKVSLARLTNDEPVTVIDEGTGIELHYRFEELAGGRLRLAGGLLGDDMLCVGCEPDDINKIATILLAGLAPRPG